MACCGSRRIAAAAPAPPVTFEYVGRTTLRVVGAATGRTYWFSQPGAHAAVDARDAPSVAAAPNLRRIRDRR